MKLFMVDYIGKMLNAIPEDVKWESATPYSHHIFDTSEDLTKLLQTDKDLFHHFLVQLFHLSK